MNASIHLQHEQAMRSRMLTTTPEVTGAGTVKTTIHIRANFKTEAHAQRKRAALRRPVGLQSRDHFRKALRLPRVTAEGLAMTTPNGHAWLARFNTLPMP